jgi:hypothetical protein
MAQAVDLDWTAAQSHKQEAVSRRQSLSTLGFEVRFAFLANDAPG